MMAINLTNEVQALGEEFCGEGREGRTNWPGLDRWPAGSGEIEGLLTEGEIELEIAVAEEPVLRLVLCDPVAVKGGDVQREVQGEDDGRQEEVR